MIENINPEHFPFTRGARVLDIGAASGENSIALQQAGFHVTAIEIDPRLVDHMRIHAEPIGVEVVEGDALAMPFPDAAFDQAVLLEVLEHIGDTDGLLREIRRVLRPGGILCIGVPTSYTEKIYWRLHPRYAANATHVKIFELDELRARLNQAGLQVSHIEPKNFEPAVSWVFHALLRSDADHTGAIHEHLWVDRILNRVLWLVSRTPLLRRLYAWLRGRIGKSWYVYCENAA